MKKNIALILIICFALISCEHFNNNHIISSKVQREEITTKFTERISFLRTVDTSINTILSQKLPQKELEAFQFLYAYMPLCDLTMHNPNYIHQQVKTALEAKKNFNWGKKIPNDIFLHFVLPYRVNNEYTDNARQEFYNELKNRINGLSMYDAALEVNHWCHEKVNYRPTDSRTSGPLTTVRTAYGRCGEESTFTVAALRAVCIPARQVYTPRWAHTDDNHAWVEVWINGKWYFLGACEPDPELNMGWFAGPSKRTMMTRTFVYGKYHGKEDKLTESDYCAELNLLDNYTDTKLLTVKVIDKNGSIVPDAKVEYQLYNYSEFYPIARKTTNSMGCCSIKTGFGDLMIWANRNELYGFAKADRLLNDTLTICITNQNELLAGNFTIIPPDEKPIDPTDELKLAENNKRLHHEDEIRTRFESTFVDSASAANLAMEKGLNIGETWRILRLSRGNWEEIKNFIENLEGKDLTVGIAILANIAEKDLHDITADILRSHINTVDLYPSLIDVKEYGIFDKYILSPRISNEYITDWRTYIQNEFTFEQIGFFRNNPVNIANWIRENINIDNISNYYNVPITPKSTLKFKIADKHSRNILFVAMCRSFGIPARLEPATKKPQYFMRNVWEDVHFEPMDEIKPRGTITLNTNNNSIIPNPKYYTHYTIAKLQNGRFETLDYEYSQTIAILPAKVEVETGYYRIVTGNRLDNGTVLCNVKYFEVNDKKNTNVEIEFNSSQSNKSNTFEILDTQTIIPDINGEYNNTIFDENNSNNFSIVAIIDPGTEPTKHLLNDLSAVSEKIAKHINKVHLIVASTKLPNELKNSQIGNHSSNTFFGYDKDGSLTNAIANACNTKESIIYPIVIAVDKNGQIIYKSTGYSIGMGDQILKSLK